MYTMPLYLVYRVYPTYTYSYTYSYALNTETIGNHIPYSYI